MELTTRVREFFIKYADRIYYGTDTTTKGYSHFEYHCTLYDLVSRTLSEKEPFMWNKFRKSYPLDLPCEVQEKINTRISISFWGLLLKSSTTKK